ncbi:YnbE family lipoprotein [Shewanella sp. A25]|nr:YnbE family lipoprotein [Shewanella shenzhenensis]
MKTIPLSQLSLGSLLLVSLLTGCAPTVKIEPPDKPIVINLNVKIEHEIKIKVDKELDQLLTDDQLF